MTGAQCLPLPSLRLSWKPRLAGWREQWVPSWSLGPCLPHPPRSPCQAWHGPLPEPKLSGGREELSSALLPGLHFLPGKMAGGWGRAGAGQGWNLFGLCNGRPLPEGVRVLFVRGVPHEGHDIGLDPWLEGPTRKAPSYQAQSRVLGVLESGVSWKSLADSAWEVGCHLPLSQ